MLLAVIGIGGYILFSYVAGLVVNPRAGESRPVGFIILFSLFILLGWKSVKPLMDRIPGRRTLSSPRMLEQFSQAARSVRWGNKSYAAHGNPVGAERGCLLSRPRPSDDYTADSVFGSMARRNSTGSP